MKRWLAFVGRGVLSAAEQTGQIAILFAQTLQCSFATRWKKRDAENLFEQLMNIGVKSLPVVLLTGAFMGMVLALQSYYQLHKLAVESSIGALVALSMTREIGPVMTAIMLTSRVGAAMAAELGTMKVTEQVDALKALATNPVKYLVVPRFLSCVIMAPILTVYAVFIGVAGGYLISVKMMGVNAAFYLGHMVEMVSPADITTGLIKTFFFGMILATISCYRGLTAEGGAQGVGRATMNAVVTSCILILVADFFLTLIFKIFNF